MSVAMKEEMLTATEVNEALEGLLVAYTGEGNAAFRRGAIDSRVVAEGDLFFALHGERADGHDFVPQAVAAGASGVVVSRPVETAEGRAQFIASDPLAALQRLATARRLLAHGLRVVGITGSVGKTTAKELTAAVLSQRFNVLKTKANLNTEIGVPLTLLELDEQEVAVLEFGMYVPGDIALLSRIARPEIGVVMNVGPVHLERVGSLGRITGGKAELVEGLPSDGLAVLNGDDPRVAAMARRTPARTVLFGLSEQCEIRAENVVSHGLEGFSFTIRTGGDSVEATCPLPGKHHVYPVLAAVAVALELGLLLGEAASALAGARVDLRLTVRPAINGATIIDDSYNASPASMIAALDLLAETPGRHVALLGHMRELGTAELEGHLRVGRHAARASDLLFVVGPDAAMLASAAEDAGHSDVRRVQDAEDASSVLRQELRAGDFCLIKASRAVGLESVVEALTER
jgi:UDP-N-acetylmuramoyl-tripeptide--D-alanyl-D-alanine ligase